ncbi:MAG: tetratricopeptide repeat protein [Acidobacteriaceae bacterium]|nr:tetratricopeptide repeat protein [Acidobacteriaceae bacterium]
MIKAKRLIALPLSVALAACVLLGSVAGCRRDPNVQKKKFVESGEKYADQGKYKEALIQFQNALKIDRNYSEAYYQIAKVHLKTGLPMQAYAELSHAVDLQPANFKARIDLGNLLLAGGQPAKAKEQGDAVLQAQPNNADALALLSAVAINQNDRATALDLIQKALAIEPARSGFHTSYGLILSTDPSGEAAAEEQLKKAIELDSKTATPHMILATLLQKKGDLAGAIEQQKAAITADPKNLLARSSMADLYMRQNDPAKVEETLRQAAEDMGDTSQGSQLLQNYYVATHQIDKGVAVYADLVAKHPKTAPLKVAYARLLLAQKNNAKAREVLAELVKTDAGDPDVALLNGILMMGDGKMNEAFDAFQKGARNNPENVPLLLALGRAARAKGDTGTAEESYKNAARLSPKNPEAQGGLAQIAIDRKDFSLLAQVAETTMGVAPQWSMPYIWRGIAEASQNLMDKADADFQQALKLDPKNSVAYYEIAQVRLQQKKLPEARNLLQQSLELNPNSMAALRELVAFDLSDKQPAKAISLVQAQMQKLPNNSELYTMLADLQTMTGDANTAIASAETAMKLNPNDYGAIMAYTRAQVSNGGVAKAIDVWQNRVKANPSDDRAYTILGTLLEAAGNKDQAKATYKKALDIQPDEGVAANNLAYMMLDDGGNLDVALTLAQTARRVLPTSPSTADTLAWVYFHKGTYTSARDLLEDAIKISPNNPTLRYHLGMVYSRLGNKSDAATQLKKVEDLAPNTQTAKDAAKELSSLT